MTEAMDRPYAERTLRLRDGFSLLAPVALESVMNLVLSSVRGWTDAGDDWEENGPHRRSPSSRGRGLGVAGAAAVRLRGARRARRLANPTNGSRSS